MADEFLPSSKTIPSIQSAGWTSEQKVKLRNAFGATVQTRWSKDDFTAAAVSVSTKQDTWAAPERKKDDDGRGKDKSDGKPKRP